MDSDAINRLARVHDTLTQMLEDRGYNIPDQLRGRNAQRISDLISEHKGRAGLTMQLESQSDPDDKIYVFFPDEEKISVPIVTHYAQQMHSQGIRKGILISKGNITASAKSAITELQSHFDMEHFEERELIVNITKHELVPQHIILSQAEKEGLLRKYRVKESQLPKIQVGDPVAKYLGLKKGQVVKIIRASETAGRYITYRLAV